MIVYIDTCRIFRILVKLMIFILSHIMHFNGFKKIGKNNDPENIVTHIYLIFIKIMDVDAFSLFSKG